MTLVVSSKGSIRHYTTLHYIITLHHITYLLERSMKRKAESLVILLTMYFSEFDLSSTANADDPSNQKKPARRKNTSIIIVI